jgi:glycosyltransferase involved in cell wall biosynthesis
MITLVCSNFNSRKWVNGYLDCVNSQFLESFDIIFIDAGSTDDSFKTIKDFKFREGINAQYVSDPGCSIYKAWNIGFKLATTKYCINFNTDDRLFPSSLQTYKAYAQKYPEVDLFYSPIIVVNHEDHINVVQYRNIPNICHKSLLHECYIGPFPMVKRASWESLGGFKEHYTISGDYEMWLNMFTSGLKFMRLNETIGSYFSNPTGMSTDQSKMKEHWRQDCEIREAYKCA